MRVTLGQFRRSFRAVRRQADFPGKSGEHQLDLTNGGFERIVLARYQEPEVLGEQKKIVQFTGRTAGHVKILSQFVVSRMTFLPNEEATKILPRRSFLALPRRRAVALSQSVICTCNPPLIAYDFGREPQPC